MNHLDLCSGIGGWGLAFRELGINTIAFCEIEKYPQRVLKKNFPNIPIFNDLTELTYEKIKKRTGTGRIDILTCSYPCQPFSVAGKRKGESDARHLWTDTFRLVKECQPSWFIGENVSGHIELGLDTVLKDLETEGYDTRTFIVPASTIGAWHRRERIWIIGHKELSDTVSILRERGRTKRQSGTHPKWQFYSEEEKQTREHIRSEVERCDVVSGETEDVSDTKDFRCERSFHEAKPRWSSSRYSKREFERSSVREKLSDTQHKRYRERVQSKTISDRDGQSISSCQENWWQTQSEFCGVPDGISYGLDKGRVGRIKGLGNAIVPQIAWYIGYSILQTYNNEDN
tara:strand:- start:1004 stop:2035 length:1032 start_codon:yes stop_codon:yes gene_type:complete